ncbi:MAG: galactokinase [Myxococcota bacterium]
MTRPDVARADVTDSAARAFAETWGVPPDAVGVAPARANLLGEHTDYNDGFVLPTPLGLWTAVAVGRAERDGGIEALACRLGEQKSRAYGELRQGDWLDYVAGCAAALQARGVELPGLRLAIDSQVPIGAGISSSAALEVATLRALRSLLDLPLGDETLARTAQEAERGYAGMPCGIMDQMVCALGTPGEALFLDTRTLGRQLLPLPQGASFAVVHCGVPHKLTDGGYRQRRAECEKAAELLGVRALRDVGVDELDRLDALPEPLRSRARHVVTENERVERAVEDLRSGDVKAFGRRMVESHRSQRDDFRVSIDEIDTLVEAALACGAWGARLTGGGFGGSIVALMATETLDDWWQRVSALVPGAKWLGRADARPAEVEVNR